MTKFKTMDTQPGIENEHLLWAYIDGQCLPAEKEAVELRLLTDPSFKAAYESLLALHHSLPNAIELSAPSLRFSKNVMEEIGRFAIAPAMKTYINKKIIYGIAGFVLGLIVVLVGYALAGTDWSAINDSSKNWTFNWKWQPLSQFHWPDNNALVSGFFILNAFLGLFLLDRYLSSKKSRSEWSNKVSK